MRIGSRALVLALSCLVSLALVSAVTAEEAKKPEEKPRLVKAGTVKITAYQAGIAVADAVWGTGELTVNGQTRKFKFNGMGVGAGGGAKVEAEGTVYNLTDLGLFAGVYSSASIGGVAGESGTGTSTWLRNTNDVIVELKTTERSGLAITGGANGVLVKFED